MRASAQCQKYLQEMGVDPALWIHAMETPPARMYFLSNAELTALRLAPERASSVRRRRSELKDQSFARST